MGDITIVTAFFDIGRGGWTPPRTVEQYFACFTRLCKLDHEIIVYTSPDLADRMKINDNVKVVEYDYFTINRDLRDRIESIQTSEQFVKRIDPFQVHNPEYWSKDYVGILSLKAFYVSDAYHRGLIGNAWAAWVDFGYCRAAGHLPPGNKWEYDFTPGKMHYFNFRDPDLCDIPNQIIAAVQNNSVFIIGGVIVGQREAWNILAADMKTSLEQLMEGGLVDDDQGLLLMAYFMKPHLYELHNMPVVADIEDVRTIFRKFNKHGWGSPISSYVVIASPWA